MAAPSDIINWAEAMQQAGDDEEFLKELLADLRSELQQQLTTIQGIIQVKIKMPSLCTGPYLCGVDVYSASCDLF